MTLRAIMLLPALMMLAMPGSRLDSAQGKRPANKNSVSAQLLEAPAGFDSMSNGVVDEQTHQNDQARFDQVATAGGWAWPAVQCAILP